MSESLSSQSPYQLILLGAAYGRDARLRHSVDLALQGLGIPTSAITFLSDANAPSRSLKSPVMAVFFGSPEHTVDTTLVADLIDDSIIIAPVVSDLSQIYAELPPQLRHVNAIVLGANDDGIARLVTLVLETFRLLRRERRLFISYKRAGSQPLADRLYDALDARGFDVFIDVRSVPPAADFQSQLWHRMSDSDVVVLIDTPGFREGRWTAEELARANATNVQILHLLWPGQKEDPASSFSHFMQLRRRDFFGFIPMRGRWATKGLVARICDEVERLRAPAIAARYRYLVDNFCDAARDMGLDPSVQIEGWISLKIESNRTLAIVPAVGIPTSDRINEVFEAITDPAVEAREVWVIYDNRGVLRTWLSHLDWLDSYLPIRAVQMSKAPQLLKEFTA
ncbi:toll/interleukin-1 receptor domain-containing protein [Pseudomonas sp. P115]|uniref:toll/interleukin-1 receptor domain-containing protein n=1 Tax=Pseudomonas pisciculturae TaxID=2730413 RepID=UPI0018921245|nr:toll/interleukin-1 receptor domain-containing protein [Pseudomonas pisciculturae]MBF6028442.1 toll/interleukin-1 receptor domain-containing protein [Pseudomonas pisciculturae]